MLDFDKPYRVNPDFEQTERGDKFLCINYKTADWLRTNQSGRKILSACTGTRTLGEVIDAHASALGFPGTVIREGCRDFLEHAVNAGLIFAGDALPELPPQMQHMRSPETIWVHVSGRCNLHCPFCYSESSPQRSQTLDADKILAFLAQTVPETRKYVIISGGEPFLYPELETLTAGIKALGFTIQMITNGTVGHERYSAVSPYIDRIQFSVDGITADVHDITRGKGSFDKMIAGMQTADAAGFRFKMLSFTGSAHNLHQLPQLPQFAAEHQIRQINLSRIVPAGRGKQTDIHADDCRYSAYLKRFMEAYEAIGGVQKNILLSLSDDNSEKLKLHGKRYSCGLADSIISIWYDGNVYPCPSLHDPEFRLGSYTDSFAEILKNGHRLNERYRTDNPQSGCSDCKYQYFCGGGCLVKRLADRDGSYCARCKEEIECLFEYLN